MNLKDYCSFLKEAGVADPRRYLATELGLSKATINSYICGRRLISLDRSNAETGRLKKEIKQYLSSPGAEALTA